MSINLLLMEAKQAYQSDNLPLTRRKLRQAAKLESQHLKLWLFLAKLAESLTSAIQLLQKAKTNHPNNPQIQSALQEHLEKQLIGRIPSKPKGARP